MKIIHSIEKFSFYEKTFVTIGTFDGVHLGHQKILTKLISKAKSEGAKSVVLTFFPHPRMVVQKDVSIELLNTIKERSHLLKKMGLDYLIIHPFSKEFSRLTALEFVRDILVNKLNTSQLIIGYDHHFGKNREGNIQQLTEYSKLYDFTVVEIAVQDIDEVSVSSTKIRLALKDGKLKTANRYLGYTYMISGKVIDGEKIGTTIGFPTANLCIEEDYKLIPKNGVYVIKATIKEKDVFGIMNIGFRPTIGGSDKTIEVHFFHFSDNLYGKIIEIKLLYFLRDEIKFDSLDSLKKRLHLDKKEASNFIETTLS